MLYVLLVFFVERLRIIVENSIVECCVSTVFTESSALADGCATQCVSQYFASCCTTVGQQIQNKSK